MSKYTLNNYLFTFTKFKYQIHCKLYIFKKQLMVTVYFDSKDNQ